MRRTDRSSRGAQPIVVCLTESDGEALIMGRPWPNGGCAMEGKVSHKIVSKV